MVVRCTTKRFRGGTIVPLGEVGGGLQWECGVVVVSLHNYHATPTSQLPPPHSQSGVKVRGYTGVRRTLERFIGGTFVPLGGGLQWECGVVGVVRVSLHNHHATPTRQLPPLHPQYTTTTATSPLYNHHATPTTQLPPPHHQILPHTQKSVECVHWQRTTKKFKPLSPLV